MYTNHPGMAKRWSAHTPKGKELPEKKTAETPPMSDGQRRALEKFLAEGSPGLLAAHGTGTGKTRLSLEAIKAYGQPADVVVPAALRENYRKEIAKYKMEDLPITIHSLEGVSRGKSDLLNPVLVVDESQRLRGRGQAYKNLLKSQAEKRLLLSGTPAVNYPSDILPQMHLLTGDNVYKMDPSNFNKLMSQGDPKTFPTRVWDYVRGYREDAVPNVWELSPNKLRKYRQTVVEGMKTYTDVYMKSLEDMPDVTEEDVKVPLTSRQEQLSKALLSELPESTVQKLKQGLPPDRQDFEAINSFLSASRQLMNGDPRMMGEEESPKVRRAVDDALHLLEENPDAKWVAYSNFLGSGSDIYRKLLEEKNVPYGMFTGEVPDAKREQMIRDYNKGKIKALLLSGAGAEGLDLKGTSMMQLLEPHWQTGRLSQAKARAIRRGSHSHLSPEQRKVIVKHYLSTSRYGPSVDEYLRKMSEGKDVQINRLIKGLDQ